MKLIVSSDIYASIKPKQIHALKEKVDSVDRLSYYNFTNHLSRKTFDYDLKEEVYYAAHLIRFTNMEVYDLLTKSIKIVENTEQYTEYILNDVFGEAKFVITPPGTIRFYAQDLVCFYNGKSWRKLST